MKHHTSYPKLLLLLGAVVLTWTACHQPDRDDFDYEQAKSSIIPIQEAKAYQKQFLKTYDTTLKRMVGDSFLMHQFRIPNAETFNKHAIKLLMHQHGVDSIRIFYGIDSTGGMRLILLGVDKKGLNIYTHLLESKSAAISVPGVASARAQGSGDSDAIENGQTCPPCTINN